MVRPDVKAGHLIASFGLSRLPLLRAAGAVGLSGSGGVSWNSHTIDFIDVEMR